MTNDAPRSQSNSIEDVLLRALHTIQTVIPYDLAAILELHGDELVVRSAAGRLSNDRVRRHRVPMDRFPTVRRAIESRRPVALLEEHHADEGDPYDNVLDLPDGHACMVVPLYTANRLYGVLTFDRAECLPFTKDVVELADVYGQLVALALSHEEQLHVVREDRNRLADEHRQLLERTIGEGLTSLERTKSPAFAKVVRQAKQVALTNTPVLLRGETGAGKEVLARAIHDHSPRRGGAFVAVNCAAIPDNLIESELFGHVRGAFTGAAQARAGRFSTADRGTLFLDEIGDMPLAAQGKLLRALEEGTFEPVGSDRTVKLDVRVVAATHVDLEAAVREGRFREDLYYRLDVFPLYVPPLRERREDIAELAEAILNGIARRTGRGPWSLGASAKRSMEAYAWPGNVRELANALERATILQGSGELAEEMVLVDKKRRGAPQTDKLTLEELERRHIVDVLRRTSGRVYGPGGAAELLGLKPTTLQSRLARLGIRKPAKNTQPAS